jgi:hypothetical protein
MAVLYTSKQIQDALRELRIKPVDGKVTTKEAASILTWRARAEQKIEHVYPEAAVRRHIQSGNLRAYPMNTRFNMYKVEDVFDLPLVPNRGIAQRKIGTK